MPHEEMINDSDVKGLQEFFLSGVLVGIGSLVLHFSGEAQIEAPRVLRRPFGLSQAASAACSAMFR